MSSYRPCTGLRDQRQASGPPASAPSGTEAREREQRWSGRRAGLCTLSAEPTHPRCLAVGGRGPVPQPVPQVSLGLPASGVSSTVSTPCAPHSKSPVSSVCSPEPPLHLGRPDLPCEGQLWQRLGHHQEEAPPGAASLAWRIFQEGLSPEDLMFRTGGAPTPLPKVL